MSADDLALAPLLNYPHPLQSVRRTPPLKFLPGKRSQVLRPRRPKNPRSSTITRPRRTCGPLLPQFPVQPSHGTLSCQRGASRTVPTCLNTVKIGKRATCAASTTRGVGFSGHVGGLGLGGLGLCGLGLCGLGLAGLGGLGLGGLDLCGLDLCGLGLCGLDPSPPSVHIALCLLCFLVSFSSSRQSTSFVSNRL
jgi:hypothetical protein